MPILPRQPVFEHCQATQVLHNEKNRRKDTIHTIFLKTQQGQFDSGNSFHKLLKFNLNRQVLLKNVDIFISGGGVEKPYFKCWYCLVFIVLKTRKSDIMSKYIFFTTVIFSIFNGKVRKYLSLRKYELRHTYNYTGRVDV
jgi:hypothetical protein